MMSSCEGARGLPLQGVRILSVEQYITGPYCTQLLADAGAEVIKIERPGMGDPRRTMGPYLEADDGERISGGFLQYNRSKKSLTLNMAAEKGKEIFRRLATEVDVVLENLRPGAMGRLGLGYDTLSKLNPRLIYAAISGFGQLEDGPYKQWPALDIVVEAMSGIMHQVGFEDKPPTYTIYGMADIYAGLVNAFSIMVALFEREMTGRGQMVDTSMYDSMISLNERAVAIHSLTGEVPTRGKERVLGPRGAYRASDGYVAVNIPTDDMWARLAGAMGREELVEDPRCLTGPDRAENEEFVRCALEEWLSEMTQEEAVQKIQAAGVPSGPVQTVADLFTCPQVQARHMFVDVPHPKLDGVKIARTPMRLSAMSEVSAGPAPELGEHNEDILGGVLGISPEEIAALRDEGVI